MKSTAGWGNLGDRKNHLNPKTYSRRGKAKLKKLVSFILISFMFCSLSTNIVNASSTKTMTVNVPLSGDSFNKNQSRTVTIPNLQGIVSVKVNTGSVTHTRSGDSVTLNVTEGTPSRQVWNDKKYSKQATDFKTSTINNFSNTITYSDLDGFSGSISKNGSSKVISGSYTPEDNKTVTGSREQEGSSSGFPSSLNYNSGGYSGTLVKDGGVTSSSSYSYMDYELYGLLIREFLGTATEYWPGAPQTSYYPKIDGWLVGVTTPIPFRVNVDGYSGEMDIIRYLSPARYVYMGKSGSDHRWRMERDVVYGGRLRKETVVYRQNYKGTVIRPESDTRVWRQDYSGTVYKGGYDDFYSYIVTIEYIDNRPPVVAITSPSFTQTISNNGTITISGTASDPDGDPVTVSATIGGKSKSTPVSGGQWTLSWLGSEVDEVFSTGITFIAADDKGGTSTASYGGRITIDKTPPDIEFNGTTLSPNTIKVEGSAVDPIKNGGNAGLHSVPYNFAIGESWGSWVSSNIKEYLGLSPNTRYTFQLQARDSVGNIGVSSIDRYTGALDPISLDITNINTNSITLNIQNNQSNGENPYHRIEIRNKLTGKVASLSDYSQETAGRTLVGLTGGIEYEIITITRNNDNSYINHAINWSKEKGLDSIYVLTEPDANSIKIIEETTSTISLRWDVAPRHEYRVKLTDVNGITLAKSNWMESSSTIIRGLTGNTFYKAYVMSRITGTTMQSNYVEGKEAYTYTDPNPIPGATFESRDRAVKVILNLDNANNDMGTGYIVRNLQTNEQYTITKEWINENLINDMKYQYTAMAVARNGKPQEWSYIGEGHTQISKITAPRDWHDMAAGLTPIRLPEDFDPDTIHGKAVEIGNTIAIVNKGNILIIGASNVDNAVEYAISMDGLGYSNWRKLDNSGSFWEEILTKNQGLFEVHVKFRNRFGGESQEYKRNFLIDWEEPEINIESKIAGQTATVNGEYTVIGTGGDNLIKPLYSLFENVNNNGLMYKVGTSSGTGWKWFNNGEEISFKGISTGGSLAEFKLYVSDINGNITENIVSVWGLRRR